MGNLIQKQVFPGCPVANAKQRLIAQELVVHDVCAVQGRSSEAARNATIVFFHGNLEDVSRTAYLWKRLRAKCLIGFEYPGYGWRGEEEPSQRALLADVPRQVRWLNVLNSGRKVILCGRSLGSFAALNLAVALGPDKCDGLVLLSPMLTAVATSVPRSLYRAFGALDYADNETLAGRLHPSIPVFIAHGKQDKVVPLWNAADLMSAFPASSRHTFCTIDLAGHNNLTDSTQLWNWVEDFVDQVVDGRTLDRNPESSVFYLHA